MDRLANPKDGGEYAFYYTVIKGWDAVREAARRRPISGISTPNDSTIVFNLTQPTGDFPTGWRCRRPARSRPRSRSASRASPASTAATSISTGPYMIQGADKVNISSCCSAQADRAATTGANGSQLDPRPQPELRPDDRPVPARTTSTSSSSSSNSNADDIFNKIAGRAARPGECRASRAEDHPASTRRPEPEAAHASRTSATARGTSR